MSVAIEVISLVVVAMLLIRVAWALHEVRLGNARIVDELHDLAVTMREAEEKQSCP